MNRALRAATVGVLLLSPVALSACSAGQVTQTATQNRDKVGAMAQVGDITLRAAELASPRTGSYEPGDDAELHLVIVNGGPADDTLVAVDGPDFSGAQIESGGTSTTATPSTGAAASTTASPGAGAAATTTASPGAGAAATTTGSGSAAVGSGKIEIPAHSTVFVNGINATVTLTHLGRALHTGQVVEVTLTFAKAGKVTIPVTVANPDQPVSRGEAFDFHHGAGTE